MKLVRIRDHGRRRRNRYEPYKRDKAKRLVADMANLIERRHCERGVPVHFSSFKSFTRAD
jgi:hypothetical protein